jgi:GMP synthase-like glutamine amidotransferase
MTSTSHPPPRCLVLQHVEAEPAWAVGDALIRAGVGVDVRRLHAGDALPPALDAHAGLVVMGGPVSATSDEGFPSRRDEVALLAEALARGVPTLGICLGAQLLALAGGGTVRPGPDGPEIGWAPVDLAPARAHDGLLHGLPPRLTVLHWHGDTYDAPPGAVPLATSPRYPSQAFRAGPAAWGFQFHIEVTPPAVEGLVRAFPADAALAPGGVAAVLAGSGRALDALSTLRDLVFDRFAALVVAGPDPAAPDGSPGRFAEVSDS